MILPFQRYVDNGKVKKKTPDPEEAESLLQQAEERLMFVKDNKINQKTAKFILENCYEAAREAAQSLMSREGFKPYSHEGIISFVKEYYDFSEEEINLFDHIENGFCL